jgi:large subunit ribosomal protein L19
VHRITAIESEQLQNNLPQFNSGDKVKVYYKVIEGNRERTQAFQGTVIRRHGSGLKETFTVRKISFGVGVERIFPVHSPKIDKIEVISKGKTRRANLGYLRSKVGKQARVKEKRH